MYPSWAACGGGDGCDGEMCDEIESERSGRSRIPSSCLIVSKRVVFFDLLPNCIPLPDGAVAVTLSVIFKVTLVRYMQIEQVYMK